MAHAVAFFDALPSLTKGGWKIIQRNVSSS